MVLKSDLTEAQRLPSSFAPGPNDVICARGREAKNHAGNIRYTAMINASLDQYSKAKAKHEKSQMVSTLVETIQRGSPNGGFVKFENGSWYMIGEAMAREKVGQNLRDRLSDIYKSSTKAKRKRWADENKEIATDVEGLIQSNKKVAGHMDKLTEAVSRQSKVPDVFMSAMFAKANQDMLEAMKSDPGLVSNFLQTEASRQSKDPPTQLSEGDTETAEEATKKEAAV
eukprot:Nitzschia sp. Nitz4//scaffold194_size40385//33853//34533//NITZ4_007533-RA/size40385-processed-gene-0.4-mRNA-1//1//CDS//3329540343//9226//frame0